MWLGTFEKTIKTNETIKISPFSSSALQFFGISLADEQSGGVPSALWGPGPTAALPTTYVPGLSQDAHTHPHPSMQSAHSKSHTEEGRAGRS